MVQTYGVRLSHYPTNAVFLSSKISSFMLSLPRIVAALHKSAFTCGWRGCAALSLSQLRELKTSNWSIRSSADGRGLDPLTNGDGRTRLFRTLQTLQMRLNLRIQEVRKDLPRKLLFFLVGFYCATAFATVIGQTGDWDILSAAVAVAVVEGIGALMYKTSIPLLDKTRSVIVMFNYWKAGLTLGLFLDSFKY